MQNSYLINFIMNLYHYPRIYENLLQNLLNIHSKSLLCSRWPVNNCWLKIFLSVFCSYRHVPYATMNAIFSSLLFEMIYLSKWKTHYIVLSSSLVDNVVFNKTKSICLKKCKWNEGKYITKRKKFIPSLFDDFKQLIRIHFTLPNVSTSIRNNRILFESIDRQAASFFIPQ